MPFIVNIATCCTEASSARSSGLRQPWSAASQCRGRYSSKAVLTAQRKQAVFEAAFASLEDGLCGHLLPTVSARRATKVHFLSLAICASGLCHLSGVSPVTPHTTYALQGKRKRQTGIAFVSSLEAVDYTVCAVLSCLTARSHTQSSM